MGNRAVFELSNLSQPPTMSVRTAEPSAEEVLRALPRDGNTRGSASEAKYVQVVVLHALPCRKVIVTQGGSDADNLVGSHGSSHAAAAHQNAPIYLSVGHSAGKGNCKIGIVVAGVIDLVAKINDCVAFCGQQFV